MTEQNFSAALLSWYHDNKRELPWRDRGNAYYTWVSEIMLQQTRVEAVKPYFERFIKALPDIPSLAACPEEKLLKLWEGLGYYSRVRNMQKSAQILTERYDGVLPEEFETLLTLPGIGRYTAGAISSIAYHKSAPAVDGNVLRVMTRVYKDDRDISKDAVKKSMEKKVLSIMPEYAPGDFNQALMELGAVVCLPNGAPECGKCPVYGVCLANRDGTQQNYPVKPPKKARKIENRTILLLEDQECTLIMKRPEKGLLAGLYEFPNLEGAFDSTQAAGYAEQIGLIPLEIESLPPAKHIFSHIEWRMTAYRIRVKSLQDRKTDGFISVNRKEESTAYAIPSAYAAYTKYFREDQL